MGHYPRRIPRRRPDGYRRLTLRRREPPRTSARGVALDARQHQEHRDFPVGK